MAREPKARVTIDFEALRARLASAGTRSADDARAVLEARARVLARPTVDEAARGVEGALELLVLRRGESAFAVPVDHVLDVARSGAFAPLPGADAPVSGVLPWRGRLLTVIDLAPSAVMAARVVVVQSGGLAIGVVADTVDDIRLLNPADVHAVAGNPIVRGTTADAVSLLDPAALMRPIVGAR